MNARKTIIIADRIISPGSDAAVGRFLLMEGDLIKGMYPNMPAVTDAEIRDFSGCVIAPLFCDHHLHFHVNNDELLKSAANSLKRSGIFNAYNGGSRSMRADLRGILKLENLTVRTAGSALFRRSTYGRFIGTPVDSIEDARGIIDEMSGRIDYLKIVNSGIYDPENDRITPGGFDAEMLKALVSYASSSGLEVWCHANGSRAVKDAVAAGVSAVIHGLYADEATLDLMADKKTVFIPTISAFRSLAKRARTGTSLANIEKVVKSQQAAAKSAFERGITVLPGSDAGPDIIPYGESFLEELMLLKDAGIPYDHLISSAAAGVMSANSPAGFVVLDGFSVKAVYRNGILLTA